MPLDFLAPSLRLTDTAYAALHQMFNRDNHRPSPEQWAAIRDLLEHLERAADGDLEPAVYLSAIPAGTGKTATLAQFAMALMGNPERDGVGMLVACNRITEVEDMARLMAPWRHRLCVIAGSTDKRGEAVRALGDHQDAGSAQVVVSTQSALKKTLKFTPSFDDATRYHYRGRRRAVVAWDEAFQFNRPVVLNPLDALRLSSKMDRLCPRASDALLSWAASAKAAPEGPCEVPDLGALGLDWRLLEDAVGDDDEAVAQVQALSAIAGRTGYVIADNLGGLLVSYTPELPPNLLPVIVTDASAAVGVHHASYEQMSRTRRIVRLREAGKTYRSMTVRIVPVSASRSTFRDRAAPRGRELIEMAVAYVRRVAPAPVLIVTYRNRFTMKGVLESTIREAIEARLEPHERPRVSYLTWGRHTATNAHANQRHVVLLGLNFLPRAASHAASGAAQDKAMDTATEQPSGDQVEEMRTGMLRDSTMQAILRGNARKGANGDCGEMAAVVFQSPQTGLSTADYAGMFPGALIERDTSLMPSKPLRGRLLVLSRIVLERFAAGALEMSNGELCAELGMKDRDFRRLVKRPQWAAWIEAAGLRPCLLSGNRSGLRRVR